MKDIDFDELDKAVNSLMASTSAAASSRPTPAAQEATETAAPSSAPMPTGVAPVAPVADTSLPVSIAVSTPTAARATPPAIRRTGRFMDMVSSSADTKPRPSAAPSREGITLSPRTDPTPTPDPVITEPDTPEPATSSMSDGNMPDPLDVLIAQDEVSTTDVEPPTAVEEPSTLMSTAPLESPFLSDAKVDKRPLNSESIFEPEMVSSPTTLVEPDEPTEEEPEANSKADEPPLSPRAPELDTELVAIESDSKAVSAPDEPVPTVPHGATSIAQQYTAQPSSGDQSHAAIYDSSQYPEPLKHPAKSKSGWLWVLWVALLLGVGAGGAILLYNFGIIP